MIQKFTSESDYLPVKSLKDLKFVLWTETVKIWRIAFPMALSALLQFLTISSTSIYAGHLGDIELSSISVYQGVISAIYFDLLVSTSLIHQKLSCYLLFVCSFAFKHKMKLPNPLMSNLILIFFHFPMWGKVWCLVNMKEELFLVPLLLIIIICLI